MSLAAVKNGQDLPYDTEFVIAEVNADILDYCEVEKDKFELAVADTTRVSGCGRVHVSGCVGICECVCVGGGVSVCVHDKQCGTWY